MAFFLFEQLTLSVFNFWRILNWFQEEWLLPQSSVGGKSIDACRLSLLRQRIKRSHAAGWICTDWEQRQLMIAYQKVRFLPSSHFGEWASSAGLSPQRIWLYWDSAFFNLGGVRWEWAPPPSPGSSFSSEWGDSERQPAQHCHHLRTLWIKKHSHYEFLIVLPVAVLGGKQNSDKVNYIILFITFFPRHHLQTVTFWWCVVHVREIHCHEIIHPCPLWLPTLQWLIVFALFGFSYKQAQIENSAPTANMVKLYNSLS